MKPYLCGVVVVVSLTMGMSAFAIGSKTYYPTNAIDTQTNYGSCTVKCQQDARQVASNGADKAKSRSVDRSQAKSNWQNTGSASNHVVGKDEAACMHECTKAANKKLTTAANTAYLIGQQKEKQAEQANAQAFASSPVTTTSDTASSTPSS